MYRIKLALIEIMSFNWLLYLKWSSLFLSFILFPLFIFVWYYKVARLAEKRLKKSPNFIFILSLIFYFSGVISLILVNSEEYFLYEFFIIYLSAIYCYYYLTKVTFQVKDKDKDENLTSLVEKVGRFIFLSLIFIGPLVLQSSIKEMFFHDLEE